MSHFVAKKKRNDCAKEGGICQDTPVFSKLFGCIFTWTAKVNECSQGLHDCSPNAICNDTDDGYTCKCSQNFVDESPGPSQRPGRICSPALSLTTETKFFDLYVNN
ncbi:hypothetical protein Mgra_00002129 [Meloidogyne graminicola]|uniref:EGF-like domain-containing protein n=1 Tax=Meloidogyne graminicola TaxID=189291 RepID=A0A8S9ZYR0_9BILA|nr:hypothetical protein Mgra_00002129 [Meloidogyne graminicola]